LAKGIGVIDRNAKAQATIIDDILDVSRIVRGKLVLDAHPVALVPIVVETIESLKTSASAKEIEVELDVDDDRFELVGDPERLRQITWNLLSNAVKFTPRRGRVFVRLRRELGAIVLEVEDTGRGIAPEFLPYVFDRFCQADSSTTRREGGLGLGLAIVRHLVELHGGHVAVRSPGRGKGSTFASTFPVRAVVNTLPVGARSEDQANEVVPAPIPIDGSIDLHGVSVLVVDDQADAREMLREALVSYGAAVEVAGSAVEGVEVLGRFHPAVLVTDIGMPDEDGYALLRRVRALSGPSGQVPAVAVTAYARTEDIHRARQAGFRSHVAKPTRPDALARAVVEALVRGP
jgi:CheY-like chemotaxis protein